MMDSGEDRPRGARHGRIQAVLRHWREDVPNDRLAHLIKEVAKAGSRGLQMRLIEQSVAYGHWTFLRILWHQDGLTQRELSERASVMEPTTFSALKAMEKLGYVTRRRISGDRKKIYVHLTPLGHALKERLVPLAEEVNEVALNGIAASDLATTRGTLLTMIKNLVEDEARAAKADRRVPSTRAVSRLVDGASAGAGTAAALPRNAKPAHAEGGQMEPDGVTSPSEDGQSALAGEQGIFPAEQGREISEQGN